jgi:hypothetical protein
MIWRTMFADWQTTNQTQATSRAARPGAMSANVLLGIGLLLVLTSVVRGEVWLFVLGVVQLATVLWTRLPSWPATWRTPSLQPALRRVQAGVASLEPLGRGLRSGAARATSAAWRATVRFLWSVCAGLVVGLLVMGWFAMSQPELWRWGTLQTEGPPLGAAVVTVGSVLLTTLAGLWISSRKFFS